MRFETECEMAVQGHPRSLMTKKLHKRFRLVLTNTKSVCNFLLIISSNLGPILPRFRHSEIYCRFSAEKSDPTPILPEFRVFPLD